MPKLETLFGDRVGFHQSLTEAQVESLVQMPELRHLQTPGPADPSTWDLLNERFFPRRPEVELRVYGFYGVSCDLSFLPRVSNLRRFSVDCCMDATGLEHLAALPRLESLRVSVHSLRSFDFLGGISPGNLVELSLGPAKSKRLSLEPVGRFDGLRRLELYGHTRDLQVVAGLPGLERLSLRSTGAADVGFLPTISGLRDLALVGVRCGDAGILSPLVRLKSLFLAQLKELSDLSPLSTLPALERLSLASLPLVKALPGCSGSKAAGAAWPSLRFIELRSMKGLTRIVAPGDMPSLEFYAHWDARQFEPADFGPLLKHPRLREIFVKFAGRLQDKAFQQMCRMAGKKGP